eukprot:3695912-Amphidinium_carterae.1
MPEGRVTSIRDHPNVAPHTVHIHTGGMWSSLKRHAIIQGGITQKHQDDCHNDVQCHARSPGPAQRCCNPSYKTDCSVTPPASC